MISNINLVYIHSVLPQKKSLSRERYHKLKIYFHLNYS